MKLINQSFKILSWPEDMNKQIEIAGRTCYKSEDKITPDSADKFVKMLIDRVHHAMLEMSGDIKVKFITNRGVTHELVRHRICSFAQESTRYCNYGGKEMEFIIPVWLEHKQCYKNKGYCFFDRQNLAWNLVPCTNPECKLFEDILYKCNITYNDLINIHNWTPQQAREVLPNALKTEIIVSTNAREWRHIFSLRNSLQAHPQMQALMAMTQEEFIKRNPILFTTKEN